MEQRKAQIKELYLQGKSQHRIARIIDISQPGVRKHLVSMRLLAPKVSPGQLDGSPVIPLPIALKDGEFIQVRYGRYSPASIEIGCCECCGGFFIRRYQGQRFCCNSCGANKLCTCGTYKREKVVIS